MDKSTININLTQDEALVLFEFLYRFEESGKLQVQHPAEETAIWSVKCLLEKQLVEPFKVNYVELLEAARKRLVAE